MAELEDRANLQDAGSTLRDLQIQFFGRGVFPQKVQGLRLRRLRLERQLALGVPRQKLIAIGDDGFVVGRSQLAAQAGELIERGVGPLRFCELRKIRLEDLDGRLHVAILTEECSGPEVDGLVRQQVGPPSNHVEEPASRLLKRSGREFLQVRRVLLQLLLLPVGRAVHLCESGRGPPRLALAEAVRTFGGRE